MLGPAGTEDFEVWPDNWATVEVFLCCATQWRVVAGMGGLLYQGLDYPAVESVLRLLKIEDVGDIFNGLRVMEKAAGEVLNG